MHLLKLNAALLSVFFFSQTDIFGASDNIYFSLPIWKKTCYIFVSKSSLSSSENHHACCLLFLNTYQGFIFSLIGNSQAEDLADACQLHQQYLVQAAGQLLSQG